MSIPAVRISDIPLQKFLDRLSDVATGFNPLFQQQAVQYQIPPTFAQFNYAASSTNFVLGQINPDMLEQTGIFKYPFSCLYVLESGEDQHQKFNTFSGVVRVIYDVYLSWGSIKGIFDFEKYCNCVESVVVNIANGLDNQDWHKPVTYNGNIMCRRGPLTFAGENWRQKIGFSLMFRVDTGA